jgi:hypothetical protein
MDRSLNSTPDRQRSPPGFAKDSNASRRLRRWKRWKTIWRELKPPDNNSLNH